MFREQISASKAAHRELRRIRKESDVFLLNAYYQIPRFDSNELVIGPILAGGTYSNTFEIKSIKVKDGCNYNDENEKDTNFQTKKFISSHYRSEDGDAKYGIKYLKEELTEFPEWFCEGAVNCIQEAALLSSLSHPNIVKVRGISLNGADGFDMQPVGGFFIIIDRLHGTLVNRLDQWKISQEESKTSVAADIFSKNVISNLRANRKEQREFLASRLTVAYHLAQVMQFLHKNRILYRNLQPGTIGLDAKGDIKLFDFSAAHEFREDFDLNSEYAFPRCLGRNSYMAPEMAMHKPYNLMADVYSFGIILWEMIELKKAYEIYSENPFFYADVIEGGKRPHIRSSLSRRLRKLLHKCWCEEINDRISFDSVVQTLHDELTDLSSGDNQVLAQLFPVRRQNCAGAKVAAKTA